MPVAPPLLTVALRAPDDHPAPRIDMGNQSAADIAQHLEAAKREVKLWTSTDV